MYICKDSVFDPVFDLCRYCIHGRMSLINRYLYIKENIDETVFMFALFKCRKSDKGRN